MTDRLPALAFAAVSIVYLILCTQIPPAAAAMPIEVGWATLLLSLTDLAMVQFMPREAATHERPDRFRQLTALLGVVLLTVAMLAFGLLPAVAVFMVVALRFTGHHRWGISLIGGALMALVLWLLFGQLLQLDLFPGLLFGGEF